MVEPASATAIAGTPLSQHVQYPQLPREEDYDPFERELKALGYPVVRSPYGFGFAAVHAIRLHEDGLDGGADPGHDGVVIAV